MAQVTVNGTNLTKALRDFTRQVKNEGIIREVHQRKEYMKPSLKKRWKREEAVRKRIREERRERKFKQSREKF